MTVDQAKREIIHHHKRILCAAKRRWRSNDPAWRKRWNAAVMWHDGKLCAALDAWAASWKVAR